MAVSRVRLIRAVCCGVLVIAWCALGACASSTKVSGPAGSANLTPNSTGSAPTLDSSYDWHVLVLAKFGSLLKEAPMALHEVLLFQDQAQNAEPENKDCFTVDGAAPRFVGRRPGGYLLCFDHDRLTRIEASVSLTTEEAPLVLAQACGSWLKMPAATQMAGRCEGRDGDIAFSAHLAAEPDQAATQLSIALVSAVGEQP